MVLSQLAGRIRMARGKMTQAEFADKAGLSRQSMINYEAGRTIPSAFHLQNLAKIGGVTVGWLLEKDATIPGESFALPPADSSLPAIPILSEGQAGDLGQEPFQLNLMPEAHQKALEPAESNGRRWEGDNEYWMTRPADVRDLTAYCVRVRGDSMFPKLQEGQIVIASPVKQVYSGDLAVIKITNRGILIKDVHLSAGSVTLRSCNPAHHDLFFDPDKIEFMNKIVWVKMY